MKVSPANLITIIMIALTACVISAHAARDGTSSVSLVDGFMVDRLSDQIGEDTMIERVVRRPLELVFDEAPTGLSLDLPSTGVASPQRDEVERRMRAAQLFAQERRWEQALREYQALMRLHPGYMPFVERAALAATLAGRFASADAYFSDVLAANPNHVRYWAAWSSVLIRLSRFDDARRAVERALMLDPEQVMAQYQGVILDVLDDETPERADWSDLMLPSMIAVASAWANDRLELGGIASAPQLDRIETVLFGPGSPRDMPKLVRILSDAQTHLDRREWPQAIDRLEDAQTFLENRPFLQMERIRCVVEMGEFQDAVRMADSLIAGYEGHMELFYAYSYILIKAGEYARAVDVLAPMKDRSDRPDIAFAYACAMAGADRLDDIWPLIERLAKAHSDRFPLWMEGDASYLRAIRGDPRYSALSVPSP